MEPFERFKKLNTIGNLWIYVLSLGREKEIPNDDVRRLIFEKYGFLPGNLLIKRVLFRLRRQGYIKTERYMGKRAFKTTKKGITELKKIKQFFRELLENVSNY